MRTMAPFFVAFTALAACGGGSAPPPVAPAPASPPSTTDAKQAPVGDQAARKEAALEDLTSAEAKKGECDPEHKAALEKLLADLEADLAAKAGEDGKPLGLQVVGKRVLALGPTARSIEMTVSGRGTEVHVLAYATRDVSLDVLAGTAAATTLRSPLQRAPMSGPLAITLPNVGAVDELRSDSRQVQIKPGQPLQVRLSGQGCAVLISALAP